MIDHINIEEWVDSSGNADIRSFREAIHIIIFSIANSERLRALMAMKGGILLALRYESPRFTKDIDFSTTYRYQEFDVKEFKKLFDVQLGLACEALNYGLDCKIQSSKINPTNSEASFPTLTIKVSYAYKGTPKHKHFEKGTCTDVIQIDYSFNELSYMIENIEIDDGKTISVYSLPDLVGEKFRAIIQQKSRNRIRRQDSYDIYMLILKGILDDFTLKELILKSLKLKSRERNLYIDNSSLDDEEVKARSMKDYEILRYEIVGELPPFIEVYDRVNEYYKSLPWDSLD